MRPGHEEPPAMIRKPLAERIQDVVYSMEEGVGAVIVKSALLVLIALVVVVLYLATQFQGLKDPHSMELAHLARQLHETGNYTTRIIRPVDLWFWKEQLELQDRDLKLMMRHPEDGLKPQAPVPLEVLTGHYGEDVRDVLQELYPPEVYSTITNAPLQKATHEQAIRFKHGLIDNLPEMRQPPLYPFLLSQVYGLFKPDFLPPRDNLDFEPERLQPGLGMVLLLLSAPFIFLGAWFLFNRNTGLLATAFYILGAPAWAIAAQANELSLIVFLASVAFAALAGMTASKWFGATFWWIILVAVLGGLLYTRYTTWTLLPCVFLFLGFSMPRFGWPVAFLTVGLAAATLVPWASRNQTLCENPAGMAAWSVVHDTGEYPGDSFLKDIDPVIDNKVLETQVRHKMVRKLEEYGVPALQRISPGILPTALFLASLFFGFRTRRANALRWGALLTLLLALLVASLFGDFNFQLVAMLWPITLAYAASFFLILLDRAQFNLRITVQLIFAATLTVLGLPLLVTLLPPQPSPRLPEGYSPRSAVQPFEVADLCRRFTTGEWLATDIPEATAWFGNQRSMLLPETVRDYQIINDHIRTLGGLHFSPNYTGTLNLANVDTPANKHTWEKILVTRDIPGVIPAYNFYEWIAGHVLLSEKKRIDINYLLRGEQELLDKMEQQMKDERRASSQQMRP